MSLYDEGVFTFDLEDPSSEENDNDDNDDNEDDETLNRATGSEDSENLEPTRKSISTVGEAVAMIYEQMQTQIQHARENSTAFNISINGDNQVRNAFYTLLPQTHQRNLFLRIASSQTAWPRLRSLFGAPPYAFLLPQDAYLLNATGIARTRTNMTYEDTKIANYSQFGTGQLVDQFEREYRVVDMTISENDPLPSSPESLSSSNRVHLIVRVQRRGKQERIRRLKDINLRKTMMFPVNGEMISLTQTKRMLRVQGKTLTDSVQTTFRVLQVKPRDSNASTAAILAVKN